MKNNLVTIEDQYAMLAFLMASGTSCRFISMVTTTILDVPKKSVLHGTVKTSYRKALINKDYCSAVERLVEEKLGMKVEYIPGNTWYKHLETEAGKALPVCVNKKTPDSGKYYLQYFQMGKGATTYHLNGKLLSNEWVEANLPERAKSEYKPLVNVVGLENIKELRASGIIMQASDYDEAEKALNEVTIDIGQGDIKSNILVPS